MMNKEQFTSNIDILFLSAPSSNPATELAFKVQGMPQLGLGYIATYLKQFDYTSRILDMNFTFNTIHVLLGMIQECIRESLTHSRI